MQLKEERMNKIIKNIKFSFVLAFFALILLPSSSITLTSNDAKTEKELIFEPVIQELMSRGVSKNFINLLINDENTKFDEKFVKINVSGYLSSGKADYSKHYNDNAIKKSKEFYSMHLDLLKLAEHEYQVPSEVITSVLWVETRHGDFLGNNNVASVFLSTALCNQDKYIELNLATLKETYLEDSKEYIELKDKIISRSAKKSKWAVGELIALSKMENISPVPVNELRGSWAGAFGMSQFLPSSYLQWGKDGNQDGKVDLYNLEDAVFSVANYLNQNGWDTTDIGQRKAVFHYNNSNAYVSAVLTLAEKIKN